MQACLLHADCVDDWTELARSAEDIFHRSPQATKNSRSAAVGMAWYRAGDFEEAVRWLRWARESDEQSQSVVKSLLALSMAYAQLGQTDEAKEVLQLGKEAAEQAFPVRPRWTRTPSLARLADL